MNYAPIDEIREQFRRDLNERMRQRELEYIQQLQGQLNEEEPMTFEQIEQEILDQPEIRLERTKRNRQESALSFLKNFLRDYNHKRDTIYTDPRAVQTPKGKRRSMNDIYKIFNYYYPDVEFRTFLQYLHVDLPRTMEGFRSSMCSMINKRVYYYDGRSSSIYNKRAKDQFNRRWDDWKEEA